MNRQHCLVIHADSSLDCIRNETTLELGVSASLRVDNGDIELDTFSADELELGETTCHEECQNHSECYAYETTGDGEYAS